MPSKNLQAAGEKSFYRSVLALVVPMALQNFINVGVQSADVIMLRMVDDVALSAASLAGQVQFIMTLLFFGLASGASVLAAQYWGKQDTRTIEKVLAITLRLSMLVAVLFAAAAFFIPGPLMRIFSPDEAVIELGIVYLRIVAVSYLCMGFTIPYLNLMRSVEKVVVSTVVYFISFLVNVALNALLIFGLLGFPALGIAGAAIATAVARVLETVIVAVYAARNRLVRLRRKDFFTRHKLLFSDFMRYSGPTTVNEILWGCAISTNAAIIGHLGVAAVAANSVANVIRQLATVICFGLANATAVTLGKTIGAGFRDKAQQYARQFLKLTLLTGLGGSVVVLIVRQILVPGSAELNESNTYLRFLLLWLSVFVPAQAYNTTMVVGIFRGGGDARFGLVMDLAVMWGVCIPLGALGAFVFGWPVELVFVTLMADEFIKLPLTTLRFKSRSWLRNVTR